MSNDSSSETRREKRRRDLRKGVYIIPSLFTTANIFCGFFSVIEALKGFQFIALGKPSESTQHFDTAAVCIGFAVLFDFLDGRIARMANATSEFGVELDSIADVLSFGIAPAVLAFAWGSNPDATMQKLAWAVSFLFLVCGALRLARFNVQARHPAPTPQENPLKPAKKYFVGMPIPAGASLIAAIVHFSPTPLIMRKTTVDIFNFSFNTDIYSVLLLILMAILALLMVSTIRYNSFKSSGGGPARFGRYQLVLFMAIAMFAVYQWSQIVLLIVATLYASMGPLGKLISLLRPHNTSITPEMELHQQQ